MGTGDEFIKLHGVTTRSFSIGSRTRAEDCAILDLVSTTRGLLFPRMSSAQRSAIVSPLNGLVVYDTDEESLYIYAMGTWIALDARAGVFFPADTTNVLTGFAAYIAADGKAYETDAAIPEMSHLAGVDIGLPDILQGFGQVEARFSSLSTNPPLPGQTIYLARGDDEMSNQSRGKFTVIPPVYRPIPSGIVLSVPANYSAERKATILLQPCGCTAGGSIGSQQFLASCTAVEEVGHVVFCSAAGPAVSKVDIDNQLHPPGSGVVVHKYGATSCVVQTSGEVSVSGLLPGKTYFVGTDAKPASVRPPNPATGKRSIQVMGQALDTSRMQLRFDGKMTRVLPI